MRGENERRFGMKPKHIVLCGAPKPSVVKEILKEIMKEIEKKKDGAE